MQRRSLMLITAFLLALPACSDASSGSRSGGDPSSSSMNGHGDMGGGPFAFGEPGDPDSADRTVEIAAFDTLSFQPKQIAVAQGETVLFEVTNEGQQQHEFVIGDEAMQTEHDTQMSGMGDEMMPADEANAIGLEPGQTKMLTWTFDVPGTFMYGCHVADHYAGGMVGTITVSG